MLNQTYHFKDFNIKATWSFFATSNEKSSCNGIGGTIKRLTARESLQRVYQDRILTVEDMTKFCQEKVLGITTIFICTQVVQQRRDSMKERYQLAKTIPGTRSYHYFDALKNHKTAMKRTSNDPDFAFVYSYLSYPTHIN